MLYAIETREDQEGNDMTSAAFLLCLFQCVQRANIKSDRKALRFQEQYTYYTIRHDAVAQKKTREWVSLGPRFSERLRIKDTDGE